MSWFTQLFRSKRSKMRDDAAFRDYFRQRDAVLRTEFEDLFLSSQPSPAPAKSASPPQPSQPEPAPEAQPAQAVTDDSPERLSAAAEEGDLPEVKRILAAGAHLDRDALGMALYWACGRRPRASAPELVRVLLEAGAEVNYQTQRYKETALLSAVRIGDLDLVQLLVSKGADPSLADTNGHSPMMRAGTDESSGIVQALRQAHPAKVDGSTLVAAAKHGMTGIARQALDAGVDVNSENEYGSPALLVAAQSGFPDIVRMLLEHGAKANTATKDGGETALTAAICGHNPEVVRMLIAAGADVNQRRRFDNGTPLGVAEWLNESAIARLLREAGART